MPCRGSIRKRRRLFHKRLFRAFAPSVCVSCAARSVRFGTCLRRPARQSIGRDETFPSADRPASSATTLAATVPPLALVRPPRRKKSGIPLVFSAIISSAKQKQKESRRGRAEDKVHHGEAEEGASGKSAADAAGAVTLRFCGCGGGTGACRSDEWAAQELGRCPATRSVPLAARVTPRGMAECGGLTVTNRVAVQRAYGLGGTRGASGEEKASEKKSPPVSERSENIFYPTFSRTS